MEMASYDRTREDVPDWPAAGVAATASKSRAKGCPKGPPRGWVALVASFIISGGSPETRGDRIWRAEGGRLGHTHVKQTSLEELFLHIIGPCIGVL